MRKYHGQLIHRSRDADGVIEIVDDGLTRTLHFGNEIRQSTMALSDPLHLMLAYTRAMMSCLLFQPDPKQVLILGLGGGSLAKFLLHYFPRCEIDVVERRVAVVKLAHGYFHLPESPRLCVHIDDARHFYKRTARHRYDMILLDAYDAEGMAAGSDEYDFLVACRERLSARGVLVVNLWARDRRHYKHMYRHLAACFDERPLRLPSEGGTNVITLSGRRALPRLSLKSLPAEVRPLEAHTGIELTKFAHALRKHNDRWWARLLRGHSGAP